MPRSGCFTSMKTRTKNSPAEIALPGKRGRCFCPANSQAATIVKVGLMNSEGCSEKPGRLIQRRAPLISIPITKVSAKSAVAIAKPMKAMRRINRGGSSDTPNMIASAIGTVTRWRSAKWSGA